MKVTVIEIKHYHLKTLSYLNKIRTCFKDIINNLNKYDTRKIQ